MKQLLCREARRRRLCDRGSQRLALITGCIQSLSPDPDLSLLMPSVPHALDTDFFFVTEQEQLDGAGIELSSLYKWIEKQAPNGCCTEAWRKRAHWVGNQLSLDAMESVSQAEEYFQIHRPVRRQAAWENTGGGCQWFLGEKICGQ